MVLVNTLVHISAPTTRQDDDLFKAQAMAYGNFRGTTTHRTDSPRAEASSPVRSSQGPRITNIKEAIQSLESSPIVPITTSSQIRPRSRQSNGSVSPSPTQAMSFPLADPVSIASAALQLHEASTQQMFDTQFAAAGLESQISGMSSEDDFPIPSTEPFRSSKRRRISGDGCYQSTPVAKSPPPAVAHTISQQSFHSLTQASSQERRDSLSAEVQVPENPDAHVEDSLALSPSTRMEVEIDAWRTRQEETTRVIPKNETASPGQDFMVSSILPDSYGLSKSDSSSKSSDAKHSGNQRSGKGIHDTFGAAQRSPEDAHQQRYEDLIARLGLRR